MKDFKKRKMRKIDSKFFKTLYDEKLHFVTLMTYLNFEENNNEIFLKNFMDLILLIVNFIFVLFLIRSMTE